MTNRLPVVTKDSSVLIKDIDGLGQIKLSRLSAGKQPQGPQINNNTGLTTIEFDLQGCTDQGRKLSILRGSFKINNLISNSLDLNDGESIVTNPPIIPLNPNYRVTTRDVRDTLIQIINEVADLAPEWIL